MLPAELLSLDAELVAALLAALSAALVAGSAAWGVAERNAMRRRLARVTAHQDGLRRAMRETGRRSALRQDLRRHLQRGFLSMARRVVERLELLGSSDAQVTRVKLIRAGFHSREALITFYFVKLVLPPALAGAALFSLYVLQLVELGDPWRLLVALAVPIIALLLPSVVVDRLARRRQTDLTRALPDTLDLMVICAEAGLGLNAALDRVAREIATVSQVMAEELMLTSVEIRLLPSREQALEHLAERTGFAGMRSVVQTLIQATRYGTPLAQALRVLASDMRQERMLKAEEKAARLPVMLTVPMICFIMPALFIVILSPAVFRLIDALS